MGLEFLEKSQWEMPTDQDRVSIVGKTGSGKTTAGLFLLTVTRFFEKMPVILIDYKRDEHIAKVPARPLRINADPPDDPGIYILECSPFDEGADDPVTVFLKKVWHRGETGLFFDEAYMLSDRFGRRSAGVLRALFTTGRSRRIPIISLTQRPMDVTKYNFTEASHHVIFRLPDEMDRKTVKGRVPTKAFDDAFGDEGTGLPTYHSLWYDVQRDMVFNMNPFPPPEEVIRELKSIAKLNHWM